MSPRSASILAAILSILMLVIFAVLVVIFEILVLNGVSEKQGMTAFGISLACLGAGAILLGLLAWKAAEFLIRKWNLNPALAIVLTLALVLLIGGTISILSLFIAISLAGIE
jgi:uncharacterized membrane protein YidH (DUF202 family)